MTFLLLQYQLANRDKAIRAVVQRTGETPDNYDYKPFATTNQLPAEELMTLAYPERWNIEEFFNTDSALGWKRAATLNLNIRLGKLSMGLIAQALIYQLRQKLPSAMKNWAAETLAERWFNNMEGDIRVHDDTIIVTYYNAPVDENFKEHYKNLPIKLAAEGIDPRVPWLYDFKVDFRFK